MKKIYLIIACVLFHFGHGNAQEFTKSIELELGAFKKDKYGNPADQMFYLESGNILVLSQYKTYGALSFRLYDSKMNFQDKYSFGVDAFRKKDQKDHKVNIEFFKNIKGKFFVFYSVLKDDDLYLMSCQLDPTSMTFASNSKEVFKRVLKEDSIKFSFSYSRSSDRSKHLLTLYEEQESEKETAYHYLFNDELRLLKRAKFTNLKRTQVYIYTGSTVNNEGTIISTAYEVDLPKGTKTRDSIFFPLDLQVLTFEGKTPRVKPIDLNEMQLFDVVLGFASDGEKIVVGGLFTDPYKKTTKGVFLSKYNVQSLEAEVEQLVKFSDELKDAMFELYIFNDQVTLMDLSKVVQDNSDNFYFVLNTGDRFYSMGLSVLKIGDQGDLLWSNHILRKIRGNSELGISAPLKVISYFKDDQLHLLLNQAKGFENLHASDQFSLAGKLKTDLIHYKFSDEGNFSFEKILSYQEAGSAMLNTYMYKNGSIYFKTGGYMNKSRIVRAKIYED